MEPMHLFYFVEGLLFGVLVDRCAFYAARYFQPPEPCTDDNPRADDGGSRAAKTE